MLFTGGTKLFQQNAFKSTLLLMMQLTDYSPHMCQELGLSGFITYLTRFVKCLGSNTLLSEVMHMYILIVNVTVELLSITSPCNSMQNS